MTRDRHLERAWRALGDGYRVDARIMLREVDDALVVPSSAVFRDGDRWAVYVIQGERARKRTVALDARGERDSTVASGVAEGEEVVVYPGDAIADGVRVGRRTPDVSPTAGG